MAYKIVRTDAFQRDLDAAIGYLVLSLENKPAAAALLDEIEKTYDGLGRMPMMCEACQDPYLKERGYRKAMIRNYIMVYTVNKDAKTVHIMRLFHGRQDYAKLI